ncbi:hypothetical protein PoB_003413600 [Plakobranchus ocellatus]|uniref:Uncharacterized protein n=1 Tax=Plakobranchus ocellatus TaxID=259542 RepID=A0AAV4A8V8_9GAST|nr:hypothetical protein PoB_003413600 [Plakobranchus ocellatus]
MLVSGFWLPISGQGIDNGLELAARNRKSSPDFRVGVLEIAPHSPLNVEETHDSIQFHSAAMPWKCSDPPSPSRPPAEGARSPENRRTKGGNPVKRMTAHAPVTSRTQKGREPKPTIVKAIKSTYSTP